MPRILVRKIQRTEGIGAEIILSMSMDLAMPVIVGSPRSGTTLLRFMLDSHPLLAIPPETGFLPSAFDLKQSRCENAQGLFELVTSFPESAPAWPDFQLDGEEFQKTLKAIRPFNVAEGLRAFYRLYAATQKKPRYGDKTPTYCRQIRRIEELLPEAHFIHIIRDGRDASLSLRPLWFAPGRDISTLALYWKQNVEIGRASGRQAEAYMEVRFEDLVRWPESCLLGICAFLDLPYDPVMLQYWKRTPVRLQEHRTRVCNDGTVVVSHEDRVRQQLLTTLPPQLSRISRWKHEMTEAELSAFLRVAGNTLADLGYAA